MDWPPTQTSSPGLFQVTRNTCYRDQLGRRHCDHVHAGDISPAPGAEEEFPDGWTVQSSNRPESLYACNACEGLVRESQLAEHVCPVKETA